MAPIVERLLGSPFPERVPVAAVGEDALARIFTDGFRDPSARARLEACKCLWVRLGLVPESVTTEQLQLPNGVAGVYRRDEKRIYVLADHPAAAVKPLLAHELVHAHRHAAGLYGKWPEDWSDAESAFRCVAEGDAEFWMAFALWIDVHGTEEGAAQSAQRLTSTYAENWHPPPPSREWYALMAFQREIYIRGARFAARVHAHGGRDALDAALRAPPTSTEQILHTREERTPLLVLMTAWDSEHDAAVFAGAWCDWAGRRDGKPYAVHVKPGAAGAMRDVHTKAGLVTTVRRGTEVMVVDGVVPEKRVDILRALWRASRRP